MEKQNASPATQAKKSALDKMEVCYTTLGQEIKLNANIVRNYLTKGNASVTDQEVLQFISICKYQQLNPFLNEAYLVKFVNNRGGEDQAQIITSKEAFMKRAEGCAEYKGIQAGIILKRGGEIVCQEGEFMLETDVLLGGWAKVYRSDRDYAYTAYVNLKDYDKGRSTWNAIKCTMIRKVAMVHALREAFPTQLGAMYISDERPIEDVPYEDLNKKTIADNANKEVLPDDEPSVEATPQLEVEKPTESTKTASTGTENEIPDIFK